MKYLLKNRKRSKPAKEYKPNINSMIDMALKGIEYIFPNQVSSFLSIPYLGVRTKPVLNPRRASRIALVLFTEIPVPRHIRNGKYLILFFQSG
jgi:hypothetical protein